jgi:CubicO group peptidase (beta-lactamase class C family)
VWRETERLLLQALAEEVVPGISLCVYLRDAVVYEFAGGMAELRPQPREVSTDTPWDLASLTKVLSTSPLVLSLIEEGRISLDSSLAEVLPGAPEGVTVMHCLQHSTGWPAWRPFFSQLDFAPHDWGSSEVRQAILQEIIETPLEAPVGVRHCYSDLGMIALGFALERWGQGTLSELFEARIQRPWGLELSWGNPGAAATEDCPVRGRVVRGEAHDLNASMLGGVAGHAGLFGTARGVVEAVACQLQSWQGRGPQSEALQRDFWTRSGPGSHRLGWDSPSGQKSAAGEAWPADGVGHLAFTGCSVWVSPSRGWIVSMCSNRLHPDVEGGAVPSGEVGPRTRAFRALRPRLHTEVAQVLRALS